MSWEQSHGPHWVVQLVCTKMHANHHLVHENRPVGTLYYHPEQYARYCVTDSVFRGDEMLDPSIKDDHLL